MDTSVQFEVPHSLMPLLASKFPRIPVPPLQDAVQDALVQFWITAPEQVKASPPLTKSWIATVAIRNVIRHCKQQRRVVPLEAGEHQDFCIVESPEDEIINTVAAEQLLESVGGLDRRCLELRIMGYSYKEIAESFSPPPRK